MIIEFTDRYGGNPPSILRCCLGPCEGMGCYPDMDNWRERFGDIDKVPFVKCPDCGGTGRVSWLRTILRFPLWIFRSGRFVVKAPARGAKRDFTDFVLAFKVTFLADLGLWRPRGV
jgi:hypothetical protein